MARVESDSGGEGGEGGSGSGSASASSPVPHPSHPSHPPTGSDGSEDESISSSDDEDENYLEQKATAVENKILINPYTYSDHVELISVLHQLENMSRLRSAYERLCAICPMSPSQWLHWLQLEVKNVTSPEGRSELHNLFRRAFVDCYSIHIYTEWSAMSLSNGEGETDSRTVLDVALQLAGSDPVDGAMLWDTAREFELAHLYMMETTSEMYPSQVMRIFDLFKKQLSRPLLQTEKTIEEFRTFSEIMTTYIPNSDELTNEVEEAHAVSENILKQLLEFENELEGTKDDEARDVTEKCDTYVKYIAHVKSLLEDRKLKDCDIVNLLSVLYDRVTSECFAPFCRGESVLPNGAEKLCTEYIEHAREYGSDEFYLDVIEKVARRCHRKSSLYILKLQHLERMGKEFSEIKTEFETSLFSGFDTPEDYVSLWLCYLEILRRKTNFQSPEQIEILRKTFRLSWDSLSQLWGDEADKEFTILQFWARIEYQHTKDYDSGEALFKEILEYGENKLHGGLWLEYIWLERLRGGADSARNIFRKAVRSSPDVRLQRAWLSLERDHGTLDTLTECVQICSEKAKEWEEYKIQNAANNHSNFKNKANQNSNRNDKHNQNNKNKPNKKKKENNSNTPQKKSLKRPYPQDADEELETKKIVPNKKNSNETEIIPIESKSNTKPQVKRKADSSTAENDVPNKKHKTENQNNKKTPGPPPPGYEKRNTEPINYDDDLEANNRTAFVSNLDYNVDEDMLRAKLSEWGEVDDLRLVKGVKTFGSICYCVYKDSKSVDVALSNDRALLGDRPMFISRYCAAKDSRKTHFTYATGIEKNKLFVKNIPFDFCTDKQLREVFKKYGELKDIRIVTHKTGKPKGLAYVEYVNDRSASAAITAVDGTDMGGRILNVAISAPPPRKTPLPELAPNMSRSHARTQLFIPTVLQKSAATNGNKSADKEGPSEVSVNKLSNSDFRNMILGKK